MRFETFEKGLQGYAEMPVVCGSFVSGTIVIHGSDLVHNEGRILGNAMAIFMQCTAIDGRRALVQKLECGKKDRFEWHDAEKLIEITDVFDVRWVLYA